MIELIVVIALLGIMAVVASARFWNNQTFNDRSDLDQVQFILKTAQKLSMAQRRDVFIVKVGNTINLCYQNSNPCPAGQSVTINNKDYTITTKNNIVIPNMKFNSLGNTGSGTINLAIGSRNLTIEQESGFIHE